MSSRRRCIPCAGDGYYGSNKSDICQVCSGKGHIELPGEAMEYKSCKACGGDGYLGFDHRSTCSVCKGWSVVARNQPE